jgi:hypothetical protein
MLYHKIDPETKIYIESVEADEQPENSVGGNLPDITEHYTVAFIDNQWASVLKKEFEVVDNMIQLKEEFKPKIVEDLGTKVEDLDIKTEKP